MTAMRLSNQSATWSESNEAARTTINAPIAGDDPASQGNDRKMATCMVNRVQTTKGGWWAAPEPALKRVHDTGCPAIAICRAWAGHPLNLPRSGGRHRIPLGARFESSVRF